jgi:hypothetical protein
METEKIAYFERPQNLKHKEFIESQSNCALCGNILQLTHSIDRGLNIVQEVALCPSCEIKTRTKEFQLN